MYVFDADKQLFLSLLEKTLKNSLNGDSYLDEALRYATLDGGKRVRPLCVYLGALAVGGNCKLEQAVDLAVAVELIHSYSLVHDDLPSMDNGETRRGKPTVHVAFGEARGVLTGDMLLTLAMKKLLTNCGDPGFARAASELAYGAEQMVYGQEKDIGGCSNEDEYLQMYAQKTGALIKAAFRAGAICAAASSEELERVTAYAERVGLAFQLRDDLLDGDSNSIISAIGKDAAVKMLLNVTDEALGYASTLPAELSDFAIKLRDRLS